jgi:hypothetical protein
MRDARIAELEAGEVSLILMIAKFGRAEDR